MSEPDKRLVPPALMTPGVKDTRQDALLTVLDDQLKAVDIGSFVMTDVQTVDVRLLPFLVREYSIQEFIEPGLKEAYIRNLLSRAYELHKKKGYIEGTRLALGLVGATANWVQWWQEQPKAAHNTHKVTVIFDELLFDDAIIGDIRHQSAIRRLVGVTKRWSQSIDLLFFVRSQPKTRVGVIAHIGGVVRHVAEQAGDQLTRQRTTVGLLDRIGGLITHKQDAPA